MGSIGVQELLNTSRSSLFSQTQVIRIIGNNVSNVNTEGYSRRKAELVSLGTQNIGQSNVGAGVDVKGIQRAHDKFVTAELNTRINQESQARVRDELLSRAEQPFQLDGSPGTIGYELSNFFSALEDLSINPSQIPLRSQVITQGQSLTNSINNAYNLTASIQREADSRLQYLVTEVNRVSEEIAGLNEQIIASEVGVQQNLTLRDQRDEAVRKLSDMIGADVVENSDGSFLIYLENGFTLVNGKVSNQLEFTYTPSDAPVGGFPPGLDGAALGHIVYDFDKGVGEAHINLTERISRGGGEIGGLLQLRGIQSVTDATPFDAVGDLPLLGAQIETITRDLLTRFNSTYLGDLDGDGTPDDEDSVAIGHQPVAGDATGTPPDVFGLFNISGIGMVDADANGLPDGTDLAAMSAFNVTVFSDKLQFAFTNPDRLATALDLDAVEASTSFGQGDARNIDNLLALRNDVVAYSLGNFSANATIDDVYNLSVTYIGGRAATAKNELIVAEDRKALAEELFASASGVSLDEEFANLIAYQKAYEGAARFIRIGDELLDEIINIL